MMNNVMVVAAHPDDEVLGCGGTIARHVSAGDEVHVLFMADGVTSRCSGDYKTQIDSRRCAATKVCNMLGAQPPIFLEYPDNRMDSIPLLDIVQELERNIQSIAPNVIYTHHGGDLNVDHRISYEAVMTACRPQPKCSVREIYCFEVLSSTEWALHCHSTMFVPNCFVDISSVLGKKMQALSKYGDEIRAYPHCRSLEAVESLSRLRGCFVGIGAAEAFYAERLLK